MPRLRRIREGNGREKVSHATSSDYLGIIADLKAELKAAKQERNVFWIQSRDAQKELKTIKNNVEWGYRTPDTNPKNGTNGPMTEAKANHWVNRAQKAWRVGEKMVRYKAGPWTPAEE